MMMRIINNEDYRLIADISGLLYFKHRRYENDYIVVDQCKIFDRKTGHARILKAQSPADETVEAIKAKIRTMRSATS